MTLLNARKVNIIIIYISILTSTGARRDTIVVFKPDPTF